MTRDAERARLAMTKIVVDEGVAAAIQLLADFANEGPSETVLRDFTAAHGLVATITLLADVCGQRRRSR